MAAILLVSVICVIGHFTSKRDRIDPQWLPGAVACAAFAGVVVAAWAALVDKPNQDAAMDELRSHYGISSIETVSGRDVTNAVNDPGGREGVAVSITTDTGQYYDRARLVYDIVDEDAPAGEVTHRVGIEVADEPGTE